MHNYTNLPTIQHVEAYCLEVCLHGGYLNTSVALTRQHLLEGKWLYEFYPELFTGSYVTKLVSTLTAKFMYN